MRSPSPLLVGLSLVAAFGLALLGCEERKPSPPRLVLVRTTYGDLPGWTEDRLEEAIVPLRRSCARLAKQPDERPVGPDGLAGTVADWRTLCAAVATLPDGDGAAARRFFEGEFAPYAATDGQDSQGLFTGYYEPELAGARAPDARFHVPLYRRPQDLVTVELGDFRADLKGQSLAGRVVDGRLRPYFTFEQIDNGALAGAGLELVWVDDAIEAFFLQIQGSGRVRLSDGSIMRVGYAAKNGHPFYAIGRALADSGEIPREEVSMQRIREWLRAHPDRAPALMHKNPSFVFFREIEGDGPIGAAGVVLTPQRSLAVDPAFVPLGVPLWLDTTWPAGTPENGRKLQRLLIAQDTGGAIKGPIRGDIFWGSGESALAYAGVMKQSGGYYLLLPRAVAERRDQAS